MNEIEIQPDNWNQPNSKHIRESITTLLCNHKSVPTPTQGRRGLHIPLENDTTISVTQTDQIFFLQSNKYFDSKKPI
jgi:hypothetical protein